MLLGGSGRFSACFRVCVGGVQGTRAVLSMFLPQNAGGTAAGGGGNIAAVLQVRVGGWGLCGPGAECSQLNALLLLLLLFLLLLLPPLLLLLQARALWLVGACGCELYVVDQMHCCCCYYCCCCCCCCCRRCCRRCCCCCRLVHCGL
jgi:hypothetical protein